jgi:hypothetical protein
MKAARVSTLIDSSPVAAFSRQRIVNIRPMMVHASADFA